MLEKKLNILMCCHLPLRPTLGGAKVYIEAAQTYRQLGHNVTLIGIDEIVGSNYPIMDENWRVQHFPELLSEYLKQNAHSYDVVEYESIYLPLSLKNELKCLLVARSVLLDLHMKEIKFPRFKSLRSLVGYFFKSRQRKIKLNAKIEQSLVSIRHADFVNVPNPSDKAILEKFGIPSDKIVVQPYGLSNARLEQFNNFKIKHPLKKERIIIAFVGTFDNRKGAVEFPVIMKKLVKLYPDVQFKLLGVLGMFPDEESIYKYLGDDLRRNVLIRGKYSPEELPELLNDCSFGIFPSYLESFGFGVLEMMAMGLPVVGYDSPGINMLLLKELTATPGKTEEVVRHFSNLMSNEIFRNECVRRTQEKVSEFIYENQKNNSLIQYHKRLAGIR